MFILVDKATGKAALKKDGTVFSYSNRVLARLGKRWYEQREDVDGRFTIEEIGK